MFDAKRLLDQFLGAGAGGRPGGMPGQGGLGGSGLGGLLGQVAGGSGGVGGVLSDLQRQASANPMASGALAGGLASVLLGGGRRGRGLSQNTVKLGGLAVIAGLAYKAYQESQAKQAGAASPQQTSRVSTGVAPTELLPPPSDTPFMPSDSEADDRARLLLTAMIAAAKADGSIDADEQARIFDRLGSLDLDTESKAYVMDQLRAPLDIDGIARQASSPEVAAEVYAASVLAIDPDHAAEKAYLQMLAARLGISGDLVEEIRRAAEAARAPA